MKTPSQNLSLLRGIFFLALLITSSTAFAQGFAICDDGARKIDRTCQYAKTDAAKKLNAIQAANKAPTGPGSNPQTNYQANYLKQAIPALTEESSNCEKAMAECKNTCQLGTGKDQAENTKIKNRKEKCERDSQQVINDFNKQIASMGGDQTGTQHVQDNNSAKPQSQQQAGSGGGSQTPGGGGAPPGGGQQPQQQAQQQPQQQPQTQPNNNQTPYQTGDNRPANMKCSGLTGAEKTNCEKDAGDAKFANANNGTNGSIKVSSVEDFCAEGKNSSCASCRGMTASTVGSAKGADLQAICSCPQDVALGSKLVEVCKSAFATADPNAIPGAAGATANGGGGTGSGGMGGTPAAQSLIDANKLLNAAELQGSREGQTMGSLGTDGGGYSGYGMGGGTGEDTSGMNSAFKPASAGGRSVSSSTPTSANATDVEKLYGPNVIHIVSDVIKNKCAQGRFMHCGPK